MLSHRERSVRTLPMTAKCSAVMNVSIMMLLAGWEGRRERCMGGGVIGGRRSFGAGRMVEGRSGTPARAVVGRLVTYPCASSAHLFKNPSTLFPFILLLYERRDLDDERKVSPPSTYNI